MALKGERTAFIQNEVLHEIGADPDRFRLFYRLFSQHTHTGPLAFYRMLDHDRGTGVETRHEKRYLLSVIGFSAEFLTRTIDVQLDIIPDAETRPPFLTREQIKVNVERAQGGDGSRRRSSAKGR